MLLGAKGCDIISRPLEPCFKITDHSNVVVNVIIIVLDC